jgi:LPXTG-site transpeptidase (sortase) family protein
MQLKLLSKKIFLIIILLLFLFYLLYTFSIFLKNKGKENGLQLTVNNIALSSNQLQKVYYPLPTRLKIPSIKVDATFEQVGLTSDGAVGVPNGPDDVAWFNLSPRPGEPGDSIIDGHSGYKNNRPAVFDSLYKLKKGDKIYIEDEKGMVVTFVVRESRNYNSNTTSATDVFNSNDRKAHLNLITCSGVWNEAKKTHSERLVVFTDKI